MRVFPIVAVLVLMPLAALAQHPDDLVCRPTLAPRAEGPQVVDDAFEPRVPHPAFPSGQGPRVLFDAAHAQAHRLDTSYAPFAKVLRRDGFLVEVNNDPLSPSVLAAAKVFVSNGAGRRRGRNKDGHFIPAESAFSQGEVELLRQWVSAGGSLFLIVDHLPSAMGTFALARAFGVLLAEGYATDAACGADEFRFSQSDGTLAVHPITRGRRGENEGVDHVVTVTGTAFRAVVPVMPLLTLARGSVMLMPTEPWKFSPDTPRLAADGMFQGAVLTHGRGRVAVFGEAAMFSAQVSGAQRRPMGMNMASADQNPQFLLNLMHWLAGLLPPK